MIDWIRKIFCRHEWKAIAGDVKVYANQFDKIPRYYRRTYICEKCLKKKTIKY